MKLKLLIIGFRRFERAPRVYKQILALQERFNITEVGYSASGLSNSFFNVVDSQQNSIITKFIWAVSLFFGNYLPYLKRYHVIGLTELINQKFDLVIIHDIKPCPLGFSLAGNCPVILDLHEYLPAQRDESLFWRLFFKRAVTNLCRKYLPIASGILVTSEIMADEYERNFRVRPSVNYNAAPYMQLLPKEPEAGQIQLVHHGVAAPERNTDLLFEMMRKLDARFVLHLYLVGQGSYFDRIKHEAQQNNKVIWHNPLPMPEISLHLNQYDIGINLLSANNLNHDLTIGNKVFEFIQARLAVVSWPTRGISSIINKYNVGVVTSTSTVDAIAQCLNQLSVHDIMSFKKNSEQAAIELCAEKSINVIVNLVEDALRKNKNILIES